METGSVGDEDRVPAESSGITKRKGRRSVLREGPDPIDVHVGGRIRLRRTLLGQSQNQLGEVLGLTFQQVQKYERGTNRVSASTLHRLANALDVPVSFFFDNLPDGVERPFPVTGDDILLRRESLELLRSYYAISDAVRRRIYDLVKATAKSPSGDGEP